MLKTVDKRLQDKPNDAPQLALGEGGCIHHPFHPLKCRC